MPTITADDVAQIAAPTDFLGINYYFPSLARAASDHSPFGFRLLTPAELRASGFELTAMEWPIAPDAFTEQLTRLHNDYAPAAIYVTENGAAFDDELRDGAVHDPQRIAYFRGHLEAVGAAIRAGAPVQGYFAWSLLDNFE